MIGFRGNGYIGFGATSGSFRRTIPAATSQCSKPLSCPMYRYRRRTFMPFRPSASRRRRRPMPMRRSCSGFMGIRHLPLKTRCSTWSYSDSATMATLLPCSPAPQRLEEQSSWASAVNSDEAVPRITLTYPALESCRDCVFLVTGSAKKAILSAVFRNEEYPVTRLRPLGRCAWLVDRHAAPDCAESVPTSAVAGFPRSIQT